MHDDGFEKSTILASLLVMLTTNKNLTNYVARDELATSTDLNNARLNLLAFDDVHELKSPRS